MTIKELKEAIDSMRIKNPKDIEEKFFNNGLDFSLKMIDVYARFQEPEYPLGRNDYQE